MTQQGFYFDSSRCTGCKTCELTCKDYNDLGTDILFRRIYDFEGGTWSQDKTGAWTNTSFVYHVSNSCNHCNNPACLEMCPQDAYTKDEETGLVYNDPEKCIGCGTCVEACPYDAPRIDSEKGIAVKCDGCIDRVKEGKKPICVDACLLRCLEFGDIEELRAQYGDLAQLAPLPDPSQTGPNLTMKSNAAAESADAATGRIANEKEVA